MPSDISSQPLRDFELSIALPPGARENLELHIRDAVYRIRTFLQSKQLPSTKKEEVVEFACPASWWQMLKYQCFPIWAKKLLPVRMNIVSRRVEYYQQIRICPHLSKDALGDHLEWLEGKEKA